MTTIAYRDGVMACDSCYTCSDTVDTLTTKIRRLKSGALLGGAGDNDSRDLETMLEKVRTPGQLPSRAALIDLRLSFLGVLVLPKGGIYKIGATMVSQEHWDASFNEDIGIWEVNARYAAAGSGADFALAAMEAGKSARDAVRIACKFDINSRPPIHSLTLDTKPARKVVK